jgi:4-hydroxy-3-methylbut-2-en-1-yl diphosphate reductase
MTLLVSKASGTGFCYGVNRAIELLEKAALEKGRIQTLGPVVHNEQVLHRLAGQGITSANTVEEMTAKTVAIGAHGVTPEIDAQIKAKFSDVIDTTCPFVRRAQTAIRKLVDEKFFVVIYGESEHTEVKGLMGYTKGNGLATMSTVFEIPSGETPVTRVGFVSQTTQIPVQFNDFVKKTLDRTLIKDGETRIIDTICHDMRERQQSALELAKRVDLMLVVGSRTSANTNHLAGMCAAITRTYLIQTAADIRPFWFQAYPHVGVTGGASTSAETIEEVLTKLNTF